MLAAGPSLYRVLVEESPDAIVVTDREGVIRYWNTAAAKTFGHRPDEAVGQSLDLVIPDALRGRHWAGYDAAMASGTTRYADQSLDVPALHRDGRRLSIEFRVLLLHDDDGAVAGVAATMRDVTAAWQERQELRRRLAAHEGDDGAAKRRDG